MGPHFILIVFKHESDAEHTPVRKKACSLSLIRAGLWYRAVICKPDSWWFNSLSVLHTKVFSDKWLTAVQLSNNNFSKEMNKVVKNKFVKIKIHYTN